MSNKLFTNRTAFTLIELLVALAVMGILMVLLFMAFSNSNRMMVLGSNQMEKNQVVRAVLQQIASDIERTAYSSTAVNIYQPTAPAEIVTGLGITNSTLYILSALSSDEGNALGTVVNVGYQITQVPTTNYGVAVNKWVLQRGDDAYVDPNTSPASWWTSLPSTYWKTLSDNVLGVTFQFYTNHDDFVTTWNTTTIPNKLPTSIGITIWAIDSDNYNRALSIDSSLSSATAKAIITKNTHTYSSRVFLPQSTQN